MAQYLIALNLNDTDLARAYEHRVGEPADWDDLLRSVEARFAEFFCGSQNDPVRGRLLAMTDMTGVLPCVMNALEVGAEGIGIEQDRDHVLGSLIEFRQQAEGNI